MSSESKFTIELCVLIAFSILQAGNATAADCGVPKPVRPLEGLVDEAHVKQGDASVIEDIANKRVALIVSPNAKKQLAWNESRRQPLKGFQGFVTGLTGAKVEWEQASRETYDPKILIDQIVKPFIPAAKQVQLMPDLASFRDSGFELAVVLDINFKCSYSLDFFGNSTTDGEIEIAAYPLSAAFTAGPTIYGRSKLRAKYEPGNEGVARGRQDEVNLRLAAAKDFQANVASAYPARKTPQ